MKNKLRMTWTVLKEGREDPLPTNDEIIEFMEMSQEPNFDDFTAEELFNHLIDLHQIPFEEEFEDWRSLKPDMLRMCKESYDNGNAR
jgi:hypothetical protein